MKMDDKEIMSTSPETLVRLENGRLITFPVAGSRPRGATPEADKTLEAELLADEKELAEHNMLVDLGRNDLGRICRLGSVEVTEYKQIHKYSRIIHICSQVEGDIREEYDSLDAIESVLPAGTLSGAPKIRACEIVDELEKTPRGFTEEPLAIWILRKYGYLYCYPHGCEEKDKKSMFRPAPG